MSEFVELVPKPKSPGVKRGEECSGLACLFLEERCGDGYVDHGSALEVFSGGCCCCQSGSGPNLLDGLFVKLVW